MIPENLADIILSFIYNDLSKNEFLILYHYIGPHNHVQDNWAIRWASKYGYAKIVQLSLNDSRVDLYAINHDALYRASLNSRRLSFSTLCHTNLIRIATLHGCTKVIKVLLQDGRCDPSVAENWPIRYASVYGRTEIVRLLLNDPRVDPASCVNDAIRQASYFGHIEIVRLLLLDGRCDVSVRKNEAVKWASINGHTEIVQLCLRYDMGLSK